MKCILILVLAIASLPVLAQHKNMTVKDVKELEALFSDSNNYIKMHHGNVIKNITLAGTIEQTPFVKNPGKSDSEEWVIALFDGTRILLGKKNLDQLDLDGLYKHTVQIKGSILNGGIDIYSEDQVYAQSRDGYRIDIDSIIDISMQDVNTPFFSYTTIKEIEYLFKKEVLLN